MKTFELSSIKGQLRNVVWALECCHGYNPCDHIFWGIAGGNVLGDKAWSCIYTMIKKKTYDIPEGLLNFVK